MTSSPRRLPRARVVAAVLAAALASGAIGSGAGSGVAFAQAAPAAPDAFYLALLRDGKSEMLRGDPVAARKSFRLACFGFLEQPVILAEGLVRLGIAEAALNDSEAFVATFTRLAEVEERFTVYASAALSADERRAFEEKAVEWVSPDVLRSLPSFAPILARRSAVDLSKLSPRERTRELEKLSAAEPANPHWKLLLAADEAAGDRHAKVLARLEGVPDAAENGAAGCLRGHALARLKRCDEAMAPLAACPATTSDAPLAEDQLTCLLTPNRADAANAARDFAARLPPSVASASAVRKAIRRIPSPEEPAPEKKAPAAATAPAAAPPAPKAVPGVAENPATPTPVPATAGGAKAKAAKGAKTQPADTKSADAKPPKSKAGDTKPLDAKAGDAQPGDGRPPAGTSAEVSLTAADERTVADARKMLQKVEDREELRRGFAVLQAVADRYPQRSDLQLLAGEIAYRAGLWTTCSDYFLRSTPGGANGSSGSGGPTDPTLRFYYAVCLYEARDFAAAAAVASTGLEKLQRPPFVESYLKKILAARP